MSAFILVHGGFHGAWCWDGVARALRAQGHYVHPIDLPGRAESAHLKTSVTLDDYVATLALAVASAPESPTLVAHSMGGVTVNQFAQANPSAINEIIYVSAITPRDGESGTAVQLEIGHDSALMTEGFLVIAEDFAVTEITKTGAAEAFYHACDDTDTDYALSRLCPEPSRPLMTSLELGSDFQRVRKRYIATKADRAVPLDFQLALASRMDATVEVIDADHSPFYSARGQLIALLDKR